MLTSACYAASDGDEGLRRLEMAFQPGALPNGTAAGFEWGSYRHGGGGGDEDGAKTGLISYAPGSSVSIQLNTTLPRTSEDHAFREPFVGVELLHSGDGGATAAGTARIRRAQPLRSRPPAPPGSPACAQAEPPPLCSARAPLPAACCSCAEGCHCVPPVTEVSLREEQFNLPQTTRVRPGVFSLRRRCDAPQPR